MPNNRCNRLDILMSPTYGFCIIDPVLSTNGFLTRLNQVKQISQNTNVISVLAVFQIPLSQLGEKISHR